MGKVYVADHKSRAYAESKRMVKRANRRALRAQLRAMRS